MSNNVWDEPRTITSENGARNGVRYQRYRITDDVWVNVHEDGRVRVTSYDYALVPVELHRRGTEPGQRGASVTLRLESLDA
jgi:hypothetical protein